MRFNYLEDSRKESKKRSLKSVALAVDHLMTIDMTWRPVSNMVKTKVKVTDGVAWRPVSHGVSPKGLFDLLTGSKTTSKFLTPVK